MVIMSNTRVDLVMDNFVSSYELSQLNMEELEELSDRISSHLYILQKGAQETDEDFMNEQEKEMESYSNRMTPEEDEDD